MILLISTSGDPTTDLLVDRLPKAELFRFNADLLAEYQIEFTPSHCYIRDPLGRELKPERVSACYFRKLNFSVVPDIPAGGSVESWLQKTQTVFANELYNWFRSTGKVVMELGANYALGKIGQMNLASEFFPVPPWFAGVSAGIHELPYAHECVSKNLSNTFIQDYKGHFVHKVDATRLDPAYPWFLQQMIRSDADITVVYVNGKCFAYECPRGEGDVDCRMPEKFLEWKPTRLTAQNEQAILGFMRKARLNFGRLDFLLGNSGDLHFLEVNTNGQWAWLDLKGDNGLFDAIVAEIMAVHAGNSGG